MAIICGAESNMSKVISFRLNKDKPREARVLNILQKRHREGKSYRSTITEALLRMEDSRINIEQNDTFVELKLLVDQLCKFLDGSCVKETIMNPKPSSGLPNGFIASIREAAKPGIKINYTE